MQIWLSDFSQWLLNPSLAPHFIHKPKSKLFSMAQIAQHMWAQAVSCASILLYIFSSAWDSSLPTSLFNQQIHMHHFKMGWRGRRWSLAVKSISMLLVLVFHVSVLKPWWDSGTTWGLRQITQPFWASMSSVKERSFYRAPWRLNEIKSKVQWLQ